MTDYDFEDVQVPRGAYISWGTQIGQHVTGKVVEYSVAGGTNFDGDPCPQIIVELLEPAASINKQGDRTDYGAGELVVLNAGLVSLKRALRSANPEPGDVVKITLASIVKTARGDVKEMDIKIARGGAVKGRASHPGGFDASAPVRGFDAEPPF